jgi:uncharacterized Zn finger protein (UPF0148 family)
MTDKKIGSFLQKLKEKASQQEHYGGEAETTAAGMSARSCPQCGAGRAQHDGLTRCSYCGFEFIETTLTDGLYIKKEDNSQ